MNYANSKSSAKDVLLPRFYKSVITNAVIQIFMLFIFLVVVNASLLQPLLWIGQVFYYLRTVSTWVRLFPVVIVIIVEGIIYTQDLTTSRSNCCTRFALFLNLFSFRNVVISGFQQISGGMLILIYLSFLTDNCKLSKPCTEQSGNCIVEENVFYILNGFWIGFLFRIYEGIYDSEILTFPPVQSRDYSQIRIRPILRSALQHAITPTILFAIWYYFWGYIARDFTMRYLNLQIENAELDNFASLFLSSLLIKAILLSTFFLATMFSIKHIFAVILTDHIRFIIESDGCSVTLYETLLKEPYILKVLGARDFYEMAINDECRRKQVFSLTQPGGHPKNWRNLLQSCLLAISSYNRELESVTSSFKLNENFPSSSKTGFNAIQNTQPHLRKLTSPAPAVMVQPDNRRFPLETIERSVKTAVTNEFNNFICALSKKPVVYFFFGEIAECKLKSILSQAQYIIWISQGLAHLAAASFHEDKYGIAQNDLPAIITSLVQLKQNIDKLNKLGLLPRKNVNHDESLYQIKSALRSAIKRSIYTITVTFRDFIKDIPLTPEISQAVQFFVAFREE